MSTVMKPLLSPQEYLARERRAELAQRVLSRRSVRHGGSELGTHAHQGQLGPRGGNPIERRSLPRRDERPAGQSQRHGIVHLPGSGHHELTETFDFGSIAAPIPLAEIYRGVQFPETPSR